MMILFLMALPSIAAEGYGNIISLTNPVEVTRNDKSVKVRIGSRIDVGDQLRVGKNGQLIVLMYDESRLSLAENTEMVVERYNTESESLLQLLSGRLRSKVKTRKDSDFKVKTPTAVVGIRGTDFRVDYDKQLGSTRVLTFSGQVEVRSFASNTRPVRVSGGQVTEVQKDRAAKPARKLPATELQREKNALKLKPQAENQMRGKGETRSRRTLRDKPRSAEKFKGQAKQPKPSVEKVAPPKPQNPEQPQKPKAPPKN